MKKAEEPESQMDLSSPVLEETEAAGSSDSKETADTRTSVSSFCFYYLKNVIVFMTKLSLLCKSEIFYLQVNQR